MSIVIYALHLIELVITLSSEISLKVLVGHQQQEQSHGQGDAHGERADHLLGVSLVGHQVVQGRAEAQHDADHHDGDEGAEDVHGAGSIGQWRCASSSAAGFSRRRGR